MMSANARAQWQMHFCVLLWGFTAILGKLISLPAHALVWWRVLMVTVALATVPRVWRALRTMPPRLILIYAGVGAVVALHWLTFYASVKLANASVAATCMGVAPVFLALVDPWIAGRRFDARELLFGVAVIPGVALVAGGVPASMHAGIAVGILSAAFVAVFGALNKRYVERADALSVTFIELGASTILLAALAPLLPHEGAAFVLPGPRDAWLLLTLALGCTLLPFTLSLVALRRMSAFSAQLAVNLEPIYAIALAMLLLGEQRDLGVTFYVGVAIILGSVLVHALWHPGESHGGDAGTR